MQKTWTAADFSETVFDRFAKAVDGRGPMPTDLVNVREACEDIMILKQLEQSIGRTAPLKLEI